MKRVISLVLAILLFVCLFVGCGSKPTDTASSTTGPVSSNAPAASTTPSGKAQSSPVTLTWMVSSHPSYPYQENWYAFKKIEEITGVKLKVEAYDGEGFTEKLQIKMASGELCDVTSGMSRSTSIQYGGEGAFLDLSKSMSKLPVFSKWVESNKAFVDTFRPSDGSLFIFPLKGIADVDQGAFTYRRDVFKTLNIDPPKDYNGIYDVSKKLKEKYPNSTPFSFRYNMSNITDTMAKQWGSGGIVYYNFKNNAFQSGYIEDNMKALIEWLRKMYAEKLIPADFMSLKTPGWEQLVSNDLTFMCSDNILRIDTFNSKLRQTNPNFTWAYFTPPKGNVPDGVAKISAALDSSGFCIASKSKNLDTALKVMDTFYDLKVAERLSYGEEGVTYKLVDGKKRFVDTAGKFIDIYGVCQIYGLHTVGTYAVIDAYSEVGACGACAECNEGYDKVKNDVLPFEPVVNFTGSKMKDVADLTTQINTYAQEALAKFILGTEPMSNWDKYVAEVKKLGVDKLVGYYNEIYKAKK